MIISLVLTGAERDEPLTTARERGRAPRAATAARAARRARALVRAQSQSAERRARRAQVVAFVVGSATLVEAAAPTLRTMRELNMLCRLLELPWTSRRAPAARAAVARVAATARTRPGRRPSDHEAKGA